MNDNTDDNKAPFWQCANAAVRQRGDAQMWQCGIVAMRHGGSQPFGQLGRLGNVRKVRNVRKIRKMLYFILSMAITPQAIKMEKVM